ncbi:hypothetical protein ACIP88_10725 [Streptomyces uncialis]|uniref:hypothetical protein n=1 Tax=Streptomyces uncialis TaxID=1048205 RepID=UPI00381506AD
MARHETYPGSHRRRLTALLGVGLVAPALVLTLLGTLPGDDARTHGTTPDGAKTHGTPAVPEQREREERAGRRERAARSHEQGWQITAPGPPGDRGLRRPFLVG